MPKLLLNMRNVSADDLAPIPNGVYTLRIDCSEAKEGTSSSGTPFVQLHFVVEGDPVHSGRRISEWFHLTEKALWRLKRLLKVVGYPGDLDSDRFVLDTDLLHGKVLKGKVGQRTEQGGDRIFNEVQTFLAAVPVAVPTSVRQAAQAAAAPTTAPVQEQPTRQPPTRRRIFNR